jgi:hypothetical protein
MDNIVPEVEMQEHSPLVGFAHQPYVDNVPQPVSQPPGEK